MLWQVVGSFVGPVICIGIIAIAVAVGSRYIRRIYSKSRRISEEQFDEESAGRPCATCGYDLRNSTGRCPECGTPFIDQVKYLERLMCDWPANSIVPRKPGQLENPDLLLSRLNFTEADLLRKQMLARGIACSIGESIVVRPAGRSSEKLVYYEVKVYSGDLEAARTYLRCAQGSDEMADE